jgi:hypothetical protein
LFRPLTIHLCIFQMHLLPSFHVFTLILLPQLIFGLILPPSYEAIPVKPAELLPRSPYAKNWEKEPEPHFSRPPTPYYSPSQTTAIAARQTPPYLEHSFPDFFPRRPPLPPTRSFQSPYALRCVHHNATHWEPAFNPNTSLACPHVAVCEGREVVMRSGHSLPVLFELCRRACQCVPPDDLRVSRMEMGEAHPIDRLLQGWRPLG